MDNRLTEVLVVLALMGVAVWLIPSPWGLLAAGAILGGAVCG